MKNLNLKKCFGFRASNFGFIIKDWPLRRKIALGALALIVLFAPAAYLLTHSPRQSDAAWYSDNWKYRQQITIDSSMVSGGTDLNDFPVLVKVNDSKLKVAQNTGNDILFTSSDGTVKLDHEIEKYDETNSTLWAWVRIPTLSASTDTTIYMYYGNPGAADQSNATAVWSSNYAAVWHLKESGNGTLNEYKDSTTNANHGQGGSGSSSATPTLISTGQIDGAQYFDNGDYINAPDSDSLDITGAVTVSAWVKRESTTATTRHIIIKGGRVRDLTNNYNLWLDGANYIHLTISTGTSYIETGNITLPDTNWHHVVGVYTPSTSLKLYLDGVLKTTNTTNIPSSLVTNDYQLRISSNSGSTEKWLGNIDQAIVSNTNRSEGWIVTEYNNQYSPSSYLSFGNEETSTGPVAYWKFDEGVGSTAHDSTGNNNHGDLASGDSAPTWQTEDMCISGKCLYFNGNNYLERTTTDSLETTSALTISAWVKPTLINSAYHKIITKRSGSDGYLLGINTDNNFYGGIGDGSSFDTLAGVSASPYLNDWTHIEMTYSDDDNLINLYINGNLADSKSTSKSMSSTSEELSIGAQGDYLHGYKEQFFNGFIDEVKIYPYARSADQVKMDYASAASQGAAAVLGASKDNNAALTNGLAGYWKMDETAGTSVVDYSGVNNTGTLGTGDSAPTWDTGMYGTGLSFDGSEDYARLGVTPYLATYTLSLWVNTTQVPGAVNHRTLYRDGYNQVAINYGLFLYGDGVASTYDTIGATRHEIKSTTLINDGNWHLLTTTFDGSQLRLFVDGFQENSVRTGGTPADSTSTPRIGNDNWANAYNGKIDEVRIYNRALSPAEVATLYNWAPGPILFWDLDEKTGSSIYDSSGYNNHGIIAGSSSPTWTTGKYGGGLNFDGVDDKVPAYLSPTIGFISPFTIEFWVYGDFYDNQPSGQYARPLVLTSRDYINVNTSLDNIMFTSEFNINVTFGTIKNNDWNYLTVTFDGSNIKTWTNGLYSDQRANISTKVFADFKFGGQSSSTNWKGRLDDLRIYNYARTHKQIIEDMNAGHPMGGSPIASQVGYWNMDEGAGTTLHNIGYGGTGHNGTFAVSTSAPSWNNNGKYNKALSFDGTSDYINIGSPISDVRTVTFWANPGSTSTSFIGLNSTAAIALVNGTITANGFSSPVYYVNGRSSSTLSAGQWQHVAVVTNGTINANNIKIAQSGTTFYNGVMDELKIYNAPLTTEEVKLDFNAGSALVLGSYSSNSGSTAPILASSQEYCLPGDTSPCSPPGGEWKLDEKSGQIAYDTSGNGNDLMLGGATAVAANDPVWSSGKIGGSLKFGDVTDRLYNTANSNLDYADNITIEAWIYPTGGDGVIVERQDNSTLTGYELSFRDSNDQVYLWKSTAAPASTTGSVVPNRWSHVAAVVDNNVAKFYVNGIVAGSGAFGLEANGSATFDIGSYNHSGEVFPGYIDHVRVYGYARTPAQVAWDYNRGQPVGHWRLDECQGTVAYDSSGVGNTGLIAIGASGSNISVGTCSSAAANTAWYNGASGKYSGSMHFDGTDDYVGIGGTLSYSRSLNFWAKPASTTQKIIQLGGSDSVEITSGVVTVTGFGTEIVYVDGKLTTSFPDTNWHMVTVVSDTAITANLIYLGRVSTSYYTGQIDDPRIYNYALTATQVKELYNQGSVYFDN